MFRIQVPSIGADNPDPALSSVAAEHVPQAPRARAAEASTSNPRLRFVFFSFLKIDMSCFLSMLKSRTWVWRTILETVHPLVSSNPIDRAVFFPPPELRFGKNGACYHCGCSAGPLSHNPSRWERAVAGYLEQDSGLAFAIGIVKTRQKRSFPTKRLAA